MISLTPDECRVLGVLVEKSLTTPGQYPLSLHAIATGASQRSNREPVMEFDEARAHRAVSGLRQKNLVREADLSGSRVPKFRHTARDILGIGKAEIVLLAELMLRGPQTLGELRQNASRMQEFDSTESVAATLQLLQAGDTPLVHELPPRPGSRATKWAQRLCPEAHPLDAPARAERPGRDDSERDGDSAALAERVARLEDEVARLAEALRRLEDRA